MANATTTTTTNNNNNNNNASSMADWNCSACTFSNPWNAVVCQICFTARGAAASASSWLLAPSVYASATTTTTTTTTTNNYRYNNGNNNNGTGFVVSAVPPPPMTPPLLGQLWRSHPPVVGTNNLTVFSQRTLHVFSNYAFHPPLTMQLPACCSNNNNNNDVVVVVFDFAEKAIMAGKAALFGDDPTFRRILQSKNSREAKALGRRVRNFDQTKWDAYQCTIARAVCLAKLQWPAFAHALLATGDSLLAECTHGDWVWGTALHDTDPGLGSPGRWRGLNILGWSLMQARGVAKQQQQQQQVLQQQQHPQVPSKPAKMPDPAKSNEPVNPHSVKHLASLYSFGLNAFGPLRISSPASNTNNNSSSSSQQQQQQQPLPDLSHLVKSIVEASYPGSKHMRGQRGSKPVTKMLTEIYQRGLFMHGDANSSVNMTVIPSLRHIVHEIHKLPPNDAQRIAIARNLVEACQDCQQVQARVILRIYGDLTSQNETMESQLKYSMVGPKEAALQALISKHHAPSCDYDHTRVQPEHQRAHLWSGYIHLIGDDFGLDGVTAAHGDRFLVGCLSNIRTAHNHPNATTTTTTTGGRGNGGWLGRKRGRNLQNDGTDAANANAQLRQSLLDELTKSLCVKEWLCGLLADINNQAEDDDNNNGNAASSAASRRTIDRSCIFSWASKHMTGDFKHRIFYDDSRAVEYSDLDPKRPTPQNEYEPFLSPAVLVAMLVQAGMLVPKRTKQIKTEQNK